MPLYNKGKLKYSSFPFNSPAKKPSTEDVLMFYCSKERKSIWGFFWCLNKRQINSSKTKKTR